jgi:hypothetical protein
MGRRSRNALAGTLGGLLLLTGGAMVRWSLPAAEAKDAPPLDPLFPAFGGAHFYDLGGKMVVNGSSMRMAYFATEGSPADVARFYEPYWQAHDLRVEGHRDESTVHLTAFSPGEHLARSVTAFRQGGRVMAFCTVSDLDPSTAAPGRELAVPASARMVQRSETAESASVTYLADEDRTAHERALTESMKAQGWTAVDTRARRTPKGVTLEFQKGGAGAVAALYEDPASHLLGVQIHTVGKGESP